MKRPLIVILTCRVPKNSSTQNWKPSMLKYSRWEFLLWQIHSWKHSQKANKSEQISTKLQRQLLLPPNDHCYTTIVCPHHELTNVPSIQPYWRAQQSEYQGIPLPRHYLIVWCHMMSQWNNMSHRIFKKTYSPNDVKSSARKRGEPTKTTCWKFFKHLLYTLEGLTVRPWKVTKKPNRKLYTV